MIQHLRDRHEYIHSFYRQLFHSTNNIYPEHVALGAGRCVTTRFQKNLLATQIQHLYYLADILYPGTRFLKQPHPGNRGPTCATIAARTSWLLHAASINELSPKTTPLVLKKFPNCAIVEVCGLYNGHPKLGKPPAGLRAKATQAPCTYFDSATWSAVAGKLVPLMTVPLYVPNTMGISEEW